MEQIERIVYMERILDEAADAVASLSASLEKYIAVQDELRELAEYYGSEQWRRDFDDDSIGKFPADLKRGVLSEDAVYDLLTENAELKKRLAEGAER